MDGDGQLDILTGSDDCCDQEPGFFWFKRKPDGRWARMPKVLVTVKSQDTLLASEDLFRSRTRVTSGDWDHDGQPDLVVWNSGIGGLLMTNGPLRLDAANLAEVPLVEPTRSYSPVFCLVDWDLDGRLDLLVGSIQYIEATHSPRSSIVWYRNLGSSRPPNPVELLAFETSDLIQGLNAADHDGDGWPDLIVGLATRTPERPYDWNTTSSLTVRIYPREMSTPDKR
jgi:hypothetical protein